MAKGQLRGTKEAKKPKKDAPVKTKSPDAVQPTIVTQVLERGKKKTK